MAKPPPLPARYMRKCGHPNDWTLDLKDLNNIIHSFCIGCIIDRLGLKPVAKHEIRVEKDKIKLVLIEGEE